MLSSRLVVDLTVFKRDVIIETMGYTGSFTWKPKFSKESENEQELEWFRYRCIISKAT